jgi:hypothetical protein
MCGGTAVPRRVCGDVRDGGEEGKEWAGSVWGRAGEALVEGPAPLGGHEL